MSEQEKAAQVLAERIERFILDAPADLVLTENITINGEVVAKEVIR
jgi:hypothetical protein